MRLLALICWLGVVATGLGWAQNGTNELPLTAGRIVILSGLPGDVESDTVYQRRLTGLLEFLSAVGVSPEAVHLLVHNGKATRLPKAWRQADLRPGNRENFLSLGKSLGEFDEPVHVLVWGHGGAVREKAVFHVAGPRITADDFRAFANSATQNGASMNWVLFFVGSGEVSRALAGEKSGIFASEHLVPFQSDPIGWEVFFETWKKQPEATLEGLARATGPRIADWYASRHLARTEDPVLLTNGKPALLLAELPAAETVSSPAPKSANGWPDDWKTLSLVNPADYPNSDAVVLDRTQNYTLAESPAISTEFEEYTQILTPEGKRHGDFSLSFSPPEEDLELLALEVLQPDGHLVTLDPAMVFQQEKPDEMGYRSPGRKTFSLPGVTEGAILHTRFRRVWKNFPLPHVSLKIPVGDEIPMIHSRIRVEVPRQDAFHFRLEGLAEKKPLEGKTTYGKSYEWQWENLAPHAREALADSDNMPGLEISTFPDWAAFAGWYRRLIREADEVTDSLRAKTEEITAGLPTPEEKVKALYEFVTAMRYVAVPLGVNSYRPHAATNVLQNNYGDCKDKANLLNTMLQAIGIKASLVLVPRFSQANSAVPGLSFNHAISRVELPSGAVWLDTTDDVCPFGMLPPGDAGRNVLVVDSNTAKLQPLPEARPDDHAVEIMLLVDPSDSTPGEEVVKARGFGSYLLRTASRRADASAGTISLLTAAGFWPVTGVFIENKTVHTPTGALDIPFESTSQGRWTGILAQTDTQNILLPPFLLPAEWQTALQPRQKALVLNEGYPLTLREVIRIPGTTSDPLPTPTGSKDGPLVWSLAWKNEDGDVIGELDLVLPHGVITPELVPLFQKELSHLYDTLIRPIVLSSKS